MKGLCLFISYFFPDPLAYCSCPRSVVTVFHYFYGILVDFSFVRGSPAERCLAASTAAEG